MATESPPPVVPWTFLNHGATQSFASVVRNSDAPKININMDELPLPHIKGGQISIKISEDSYQAGLNKCKLNLVGRIILPNGAEPWKTPDLRTRLQSLWSEISNWTIIPMGRGFFVFQFASMDDLQRIWAHGSVLLKPGVLRLSRWHPDFSPSTYKNTHAQLWVRFWDLGLQYWEPKTLFEIARGIGLPIKIDPATLNRRVGLFARVLIDVDLSSNPPKQLLVERANGESILLKLEFEKFPDLCASCGNIGHSIVACRVGRDATKSMEMDSGRGRSVSRAQKKRNRRVKSKSVKGKKSIAEYGKLITIDPSSPTIVVNPGDGTKSMLVEPLMGTEDAIFAANDSIAPEESLSIPPGFEKTFTPDAGNPVVNAVTPSTREVSHSNDPGFSDPAESHLPLIDDEGFSPVTSKATKKKLNRKKTTDNTKTSIAARPNVARKIQ